eukprot:SAG31_NODE_36458_length_313_cov_0.724299_1_plen_48_part_10
MATLYRAHSELLKVLGDDSSADADLPIQFRRTKTSSPQTDPKTSQKSI